MPAKRFAGAEVLIPVDLRPAPPRERYETRTIPSDSYVTMDTEPIPSAFRVGEARLDPVCPMDLGEAPTPGAVGLAYEELAV